MHQYMKEIDEPNFAELESRVFSDDKNGLRIGGEELRPEIRSLLRDQADGFLRSELFEILSATIFNESARLALQSTSDTHTEFAKALYYWNVSMKKMFIRLAKKS